MEKLYPPIYQGILNCLKDVFVKGYFADKAIEYHFKNNKKWGARDRKLFARAVYDIVRWWRKLLVATGVNWNDELLLWQQVRIPSTEELEKVIFAWALLNDVQVGEDQFDKKTITSKIESLKGFANLHSYPDWLVAEFETQRPTDFQEVLQALNQQAPAYLRVNSLLKNRSEVIKELLAGEYQVVAVKGSDVAIELKERKNIFVSQSFQSGHLEMQDLSSQKVSDILDPQPGEVIVDACAGAGGKTLHIGAKMNNKGKLIALDIHNKKLSELKRRIRRAKLDNVEIRHIESSKIIKRLEARADRVLLDVPCSGSGVMKRNPDTKWKLQPDRLQELIEMQRQILNDYAKLLKPGGVMVYSTCSVFPTENEKQIQHFLSENSGWQIEQEEVVLPTQGPYDGFYICKLRRQSN